MAASTVQPALVAMLSLGSARVLLAGWWHGLVRCRRWLSLHRWWLPQTQVRTPSSLSGPWLPVPPGPPLDSTGQHTTTGYSAAPERPEPAVEALPPR